MCDRIRRGRTYDRKRSVQSYARQSCREGAVHICIVHLIRNSMSFASWKDRKAIAQALRSVYRAENAEAGLAALEAFEEGPWGQKYPAIAQSWRRHWQQVIPFFAFSAPIRRIIYTTDEIDKTPRVKSCYGVRARALPR
jgi:transposase-like protein